MQTNRDVDRVSRSGGAVAGRSRGRRANGHVIAKMASATFLGLLVLITSTAHSAFAQDGNDGSGTSITVSEEPGICSSQGTFCERLLDWTGNEGFAETAAWLLGTPLKILSIIGLAFLCNRFARRSIRGITNRVATLNLPDALVSDHMAERSRQRADSVGTMLRSTASSLIFGIAGIVTLDIVGISVVPIVASLGIAGIAIGFGAQHLVEDLISGLMLIIEDQLGVGDRVDVGVVEGDVERLTLRSTVILAPDGVRWYVPNSAIRHVANESQHKGRASVKIGVSYESDLRSVASMFHDVTLAMAAEDRWVAAGVEDIREPFVADLAANAVVVEVRAFVVPAQRRAFERALRVRLVEAANQASIDLWVRTAAS